VTLWFEMMRDLMIEASSAIGKDPVVSIIVALGLALGGDESAAK
jgi:hypothetical protein